MPFRTLKLKAGVDLEASPTLNNFQIAASNLIRFYGGLAEKLGGWAQKTAQTFIGTASGLHGWADIIGNAYLAIGTEQRLQVLENGSILDLTPLIATDNVAVNFSTIINTPTVTIVDATTNPNAGSWINIQTQVAVGGIVPFGYYLVQTVVSPTSYTITAASNATATVNNGGAVPSYTTTSTFSTVSVQLAAHGLVAGSLFNAAVSTTVASVVISGIYSVTSRTDADNFVITTTGTANANTTASENGGNVRIQYLLPSGTSVDTAITGYGIGDYGAGDYGTGGTGQITAPGRQWSLDHFGQDLIASPSGGEIYFWQPPNAAPATVVDASAPIYNNTVFVMPQAEIIVSLGAEIGTTLQPLLIRWCDAGDFTDWTASATNQAGSYTIPTGSTLVGGLAAGLGAVLWTDNDVWSMTYIGFPLVFGFNRVAQNCGLVAQKAAGVDGTTVIWLGLHQFYNYAIGGGVQPMECAVWDFYFYNVDFTNLSLIHCAVNTVFNEMAWHFPLKTTSPVWSSATPFGYVKFNYVEQCWDFGISLQYQRTASIPHSPAGNPIGADLAGLLQEHEIGFDANGQAMMWSWQTGFFELDEAETFMFSDFLIPDFVTENTSPTFVPSIQTLDYPFGTPTAVVVPPFSMANEFITYSARGRFMSFGFAGAAADVGTFNRLGAVRIRTAADGRF